MATGMDDVLPGVRTTEKTEIQKMNGQNFRPWKFKMKMLLVQRELWESVTGEDADQKKNDKAMSLIRLSMADCQIVHIQECTTAQEAWEVLGKIYENPSTANKMYLQEKMFSTKMKNSESAQDHIAEMKRIVADMGIFGMKTEDEQYKITLLRSLPASYDTLIVTLENQLEQLSIEDLHARILREELRKKNENPGDRSDATLFGAQESKNHKADIECFHCHRKGHKKIDCWFLKKGKDRDDRKGRQKSMFGKSKKHGNV